jgi:Thioredoxin reductase
LKDTMSQYLIDRILTTANIEVMDGVEVESVNGKGSLESVVVKSAATGEKTTIPVSAMFIFIGVRPHTDAFTMLARDESGFVLTGHELPQEYGRPKGWPLERAPFTFETNVPGVFAAGDVRAGSNRRVAAAVGEGSATIHSVHLYLATV